MSTETIPELLARLEREHVSCRLGSQCGYCECGRSYPCQTARVVAHARSLEAALAADTAVFAAVPGWTALADLGVPHELLADVVKTHNTFDWRAALGEAQ